MRTRKEITEDAERFAMEGTDAYLLACADAQLEVLLDIREALQTLVVAESLKISDEEAGTV